MIQVFNIQDGLLFGILNLNEFYSEQNLISKREIETLGKNYLLAHLTNPTTQLVYDDKGKPYLANDSRHISISHSHDKLVIIINVVDAVVVTTGHDAYRRADGIAVVPLALLGR